MRAAKGVLPMHNQRINSPASLLTVALLLASSVAFA